MTIHFICRGNVLRSLIAETYLRSLHLADVHVRSSGTNVDLDDPLEQTYFENTLALFRRHGVAAYAKPQPEALTAGRITDADLTICLNQRVIDEAQAQVTLPTGVINWNVTDIGEGERLAHFNNLSDLEEEIYQEITTLVDELVARQGFTGTV